MAFDARQLGNLKQHRLGASRVISRGNWIADAVHSDRDDEYGYIAGAKKRIREIWPEAIITALWIMLLIYGLAKLAELAI